MKFLFTFIAILNFLPLFSQQDEFPLSSTHKLKFGILFSQDLDYRILTNNDGIESNNQVIDFLNKTESCKPGYTTGFVVSFRLKQNMTLGTGVQYSNKGYQNVKRNVMWPLPDQNSIIFAKYIYKDHYIDIPLNVKFNFGHKNISFLAGSGITTNIFLNETQTIIYRYEHGPKHVESASTPYNYNPINLSPGITIGLEYQRNERMYFRAESFFEYGILKMIDAPISSHLWRAGIQVSYYFLSL